MSIFGSTATDTIEAPLRVTPDWRSGLAGGGLCDLFAGEGLRHSTLNHHQLSMNQADVDALCRAARAAWWEAGPRRRTVTFYWRGKLYRSRWTNLRMLIDSSDGYPVACLWGG